MARELRVADTLLFTASGVAGISLNTLDLSGNLLNGTIPSTIVGLPNLEILVLSKNQLSGSIPLLFGKLCSRIDISYNQLSGVIPQSLGDLRYVTALSLSFNQLSGGIPSSLGDLKKLSILDLSFNKLSGSIPSLRGLSWLIHLSLQNNKLSGSIPSKLGLSSLKYLDLSSNLLSGLIPSLVSLTSLEELRIGNNSLSGPVPDMSFSLELCGLSNNTDLCAHPEISNLCTVGLVTCNLDCRMMNAWLPKMFDDSTCCSQTGIGCINDRITNLYVYF
jgi:Leucine-rich repeat (LRR) protein